MHNNYERAIRLISALEGQGSESKSFIPKMKSVPVILLLAGLMTLNASVSTAAKSQNDQQGQVGREQTFAPKWITERLYNFFPHWTLHIWRSG
jgi:hypothetical protein